MLFVARSVSAHLPDMLKQVLLYRVRKKMKDWPPVALLSLPIRCQVTATLKRDTAKHNSLAAPPVVKTPCSPGAPPASAGWARAEGCPAVLK